MSPELEAWERRRDSRVGRVLARTSSRSLLQEAVTALRGLVPWRGAVDATNPDCASLRRALQIGAFETADRILRERADDLEARAAVLIEALLVVGRRDEAMQVASQHRLQLERTDRGVAMLELLHLGSGGARLPSGRVNCLGLDRAIQRGELDLCDTTTQLRWLGWRASSIVDLDLLFFNAARRSDPSAALRFLRRYFAAYRLPSERLRWHEPVEEGALPSLDFGWQAKHRGGPLVSVLVAARNAAPTVISAIDSLLAQSYEPLEVLVADDASQDGTLEAIGNEYRADPRVRVFASRVNQGPYNIKNALSEHARGELLAFHDADDLALPFRIAHQVAELRREARIGCVAHGLRLRPNGTFAFFKDQRATRISPVSLMLRRDTFHRIGRFRSAWIGADGELQAKLVHLYGSRAIKRLREPLTVSSWGARSITRAVGTESLEDGYRSPSRRAYSELVALCFALGAAPSDVAIEVRLRETNNWAEPHPVEELT